MRGERCSWGDSPASPATRRRSTSRIGPCRALDDDPDRREAHRGAAVQGSTVSAGFAELSRVPSHDGEPARGRRSEESVGHLVVERFVAPPLVLHDPRACPGFGQPGRRPGGSKGRVTVLSARRNHPPRLQPFRPAVIRPLRTADAAIGTADAAIDETGAGRCRTCCGRPVLARMPSRIRLWM